MELCGKLEKVHALSKELVVTNLQAIIYQKPGEDSTWAEQPWLAIFHRVAKNQTQLQKPFSTQAKSDPVWAESPVFCGVWKPKLVGIIFQCFCVGN